MPRALPPLNPLRTFEAAARHVSFTRAAEELGVTSTAVSRQVGVLEAFLGRPLFERRNSDLSLTQAGAAYLATVQAALDSIAAATVRLAHGEGERLVVRCDRSLALRWLNPRLVRFRRRHPQIAVEIATRPGSASDPLGGGELWIGPMPDEYESMIRLPLFEKHVAPICAPALLQALDPSYRPADLLRQPLLACTDQPHAWRSWLCTSGVTEVPLPALSFDDAELLYDAARQGLGFAIAPLALFDDLLRSGELVAPFPAIVEGDIHLAYPSSAKQSPVEDFALWLVEDVRREQAPHPLSEAA